MKVRLSVHITHLLNSKLLNQYWRLNTNFQNSLCNYYAFIQLCMVCSLFDLTPYLCIYQASNSPIGIWPNMFDMKCTISGFAYIVAVNNCKNPNFKISMVSWFQPNSESIGAGFDFHSLRKITGFRRTNSSFSIRKSHFNVENEIKTHTSSSKLVSFVYMI